MNNPFCIRPAAALAALTLAAPAAVAQISSSFDPATQTLLVHGDSQPNHIVIEVGALGEILVNGGPVWSILGPSTVVNTSQVIVHGGFGDDLLQVDDVLAALPACALHGGEGNDLLIGGDGADVLRGGAGNDTLLGNRGNDVMSGDDGIDVLRGGAGNDTLLGNRGNDVVLGNEDDDLLIWNHGDGSDLVDGGAGFDTAQVNGADGAGDDFSISPNGQRVRFGRNNLSQFHLDIGTTETLDVNGQGGSDVIIGSVGLNGLISLELDGGEGNDLLIGGDGADVLRGGAGNDTLLGNRGNDVVLGEAGDDQLTWNDGDGSDLFEGGVGFDTVQVNGNPGAGDDFSIDPNGERVRMGRSNLGVFSLDIGTTETLDVNGQGGGDVIIASVGLANLIALDLDGGEGNDLLIGGDGPDVLRGGPGNDRMLAGPGDDTLLGEDGHDAMLGGPGIDFANGGAGRDRAVGCETVVNL